MARNGQPLAVDFRVLVMAFVVLGVLLAPGRCLAAHFGYRTLRQGATGEDVWYLQSLLGRMGLFHGEPTGYFGPRTATSLRAFQSTRGFARTGVAAGETLATLRLLVAMLEWNEFGYEVREGDTLDTIAQAYEIPARVIAALNGLDEAVTLKPGDHVIIPVPEFTMHEVCKGETLTAIAGDYGVSWKALAAWNGIKHPYVIYPGEMLVIPVPGTDGAGPEDGEVLVTWGPGSRW
ncbi:MAG: LysM peptidoglycan-binding domain-containing protein [Ignavibacteriales bacterium]